MSYLKRSWLLLLVVFLAACGTQTQLPEVALDEEANIEVATGKKLPANFYKKVEGTAPKGAKYKLQLICYEKNNHKKIVLRQTVVLGPNNQYKDAGRYSGLGGYTCVVSEIDNKHYDTGDHVKIVVKDAHKTYLHKTYVGGKTVTSDKFKPGNKKLEIIVTNIYKKPTPVPNEKTKVSFIKKFVDEHGNTVDVPEKAAKFELICRIGHEDKVVDTFYFGGKYNAYANQYHRGLDCYLKETFYDKHYDLVSVHFSGYTYTRHHYDDKNPFVSNVNAANNVASSARFTIPAKGKLHFIIVDKLKKRVVETPKVELEVIKKFVGGHPTNYDLTLKLICYDSKHNATEYHLPLTKYEHKGHYDLHGKKCVVKEYFKDKDGKYELEKVGYKVNNGHEYHKTPKDGHTESNEIHFDYKNGKVVIIIINYLKEVEKPKLELEIKKEFKLGYNGPTVHPNPSEFKLILICGGREVFSTTKTHDKAYLHPDDVQGKHCELKEVFKDERYKAFQYSVAYDDGVEPKTTYNDCNTAKEDWCEFSRYDVNAKATKLHIYVVDNVKEKRQKLELVIKKEFKLGYDGYVVHPEHYELEIKLICDDKVVAETDGTHYTAYVYADEVQGKDCELKEKFVDDEYEAVQYRVAYDDGVTPATTYNNCSDDRCEYSRYNVGAKATKLIIDITNNVKKREVKPHSA